MNNLIFLIETVTVFGLLTIVTKVFKKEGVIAWVGLATVLANIITAKNANIFGLSTAIGTVLFASTFLATDILMEKYGKKEAHKAVLFGLFSSALLIITTQIALLYTPSEFDVAHEHMKELFGLNLTISFASMLMYVVANIMDILIFEQLKKATGGKALWLRNNVATIVCNCLENFGFVAIAFGGIYDNQTITTIALSTSAIELLAAIIDTPFLYIATHEKK